MDFWPLCEGVYYYEEVQTVDWASEVDVDKRSQGDLATGHDCSGTLDGVFECVAQLSHLFTKSAMLSSILGQYTWLRAIAFIRSIPGCPRWSCLRIRCRNLSGITKRLDIMTQPFTTDSASR